MSVSIKVAVRCRPYTIDDKLGVHMLQLSATEGEINILNSSYSTKRFAFSWCWWSAYGWERHQKGDKGLSEAMKMVTQSDVYEATGVPVRSDVVDGNAVVRCVAFSLFYSRRFINNGPSTLRILNRFCFPTVWSHPARLSQRSALMTPPFPTRGISMANPILCGGFFPVWRMTCSGCPRRRGNLE